MSMASTPGQPSGSQYSGNYPSPALQNSSKPTRILACVLCQHRKIKCDRSFPCANCVKANVTCTPSTPAPARKRRRPNQDLQERLARCEELLKAYATEKPGGDASFLNGHGCQLFGEESSLKWKPPGKLIVEDDGGVRFVDSFMLGAIHDELRAMREIIDDEDNDDTTPETVATPDDNANMVLGAMHATITTQPTLEELMPPPALIFRLWQIYLERVNPLTKIIHVPTLQPYVAEATSGGHNVPQNIKTLLFSIYTLATVSMTNDECLNFLGYSRQAALERFSEGVRQSLIRLGFLKAYDIETLQALVIYLGRYNRHAAWILNGVVLRIAQKMGLHRDGEVLGLSPFDTEIRRRLWWQIIMVDAKYALMSGLSHSMLPHLWDTKEPSNVNDADLHLASTEPVQNREGPTEMIMVLLMSRVARFLLQTPGIEPMFLLGETDSFMDIGGPSPEQIAIYRQMITNLGNSLLEVIDKYCDPSAGPLHEMAIDIKADILDKIETLLLPPEEKTFTDEVKTPADTVFRISVRAIQHENKQLVKTRAKGFSWFSRLDFQVNIFLFVVGQLCSRTSGRLVEMAWEAVQATYENYEQLLDITQRPHYQAALYVLKAWKVRREILRIRSGGLTAETPDYILKLQCSMPPQDDSKSDLASMPASSVVAHSVDMSRSVETPKIETGPDATLDQFFAQPYIDSNIDWDMWGAIMPTEANASAFDGFGSIDVPPGTQW
ncbi:c6 zinc finger domain containing protein [Grosmannia clavigera kw1407]|uniref:C6 zinc finger domain containing protein n=1 Tax=Grosmannia clavigera (strain kw1407 / UAMH 11150) TaxID=655863 RepID=F0XCG0_GROCL|nr:c6 zinc finger domain containing protein [Grosmannia clavigera kw1407]EFX04460.1 c6 zinc finger domain containing protein [Grosmannia clavigera kw1407]